MWAIVWRTIVKYSETDGEQRAASFAYYALFSLVPLTVMLISVGTKFLGNQAEATQTVLQMMGDYLPMDVTKQATVTDIVESFMRMRLGASIVSFPIVLWCSLRFFQSLVHGVNRAWGTKEYTWWRLPLKNLLMMLILASALLVGLVVPAVLTALAKAYQQRGSELGFDVAWFLKAIGIARFFLPPLLLFYALTLFYKFAPRRRTTVREVWIEALIVTTSLGALRGLFLIYTTRFAGFDVLYGAFGSVVALLMWIYLSGALIILGGCICAARSEIMGGLGDQAIPETER
jgi:Ca2+-transporting ATPase